MALSRKLAVLLFITLFVITLQRTVNKKKTAKGRPAAKKGPKIIKEFALQHLMDIGISSNEANKFIRSNKIRGKPLEQQYEKIREVDMNTLEKRILRNSNRVKLVLNHIKRSKRAKKH